MTLKAFEFLSKKRQEKPRDCGITMVLDKGLGLETAESLMNNLDIEDDRPIHQRLFSTQEEPCIMPMPPESLKEAETAGTADEANLSAAKEGINEAAEEKPEAEKGDNLA